MAVMPRAESCLIVAPNWIGDALMAQPLLTLLKQSAPKQMITVLAPSWVAPVFEAMPEVDQVIATSFQHRRWHWRQRWHLARSLHAQGYQRAYVLPNSWKSALIPWLAGIPERHGYLGEARYGLLTQYHRQPPQNMPMVQRYAQLARVVSADTHTQALPQPKLQLNPALITATLEKFAIEQNSQRPIVALCPGAEFGLAKRWPTAHFAQLLDAVKSDFPDAQCILLGGSNDRFLAEEISAATTASVQVLAGVTTLTEAMALIAAATVVVSNDSGLMHVAAALRRPQIAVFGSSDPRHTPPLSDRAQVVWLQLQCSPCFERHCPLGHLRCLNDITPQRVFELIRPLLAS